MTITEQVRELLDINDTRVVGRIGSDQLFADGCDDCPRFAVILTETVITLGRGVEREGGIYCFGHGMAAIHLLTGMDVDEIAVTVPASLLAAYNTLAA